MNEKRALLLSLVFPPDAVSTAQLFGEIAEDLVAKGWKLDVITTKPHYNVDVMSRSRQPLFPLWGGLVATSVYHGVRVFHTAMPRKSGNVAARIFGWLGFHLLSIAVAFARIGEIDVVVAPSPPMTIGLVAWLIGVAKRAPFVYNVQELYPDAAIRLGALREGKFLEMLRWIERFIYRKAFAVTTIAPGMAQRISERVENPSKVRIIPNFVDTKYIAARPKDNPFSREFGITDKFTVLYAGNMGPAQGLETVLQAAAMTADDSRIKYLFVGEGISREKLVAEARDRGLSNVLFISQQPYTRVPDIYGAADLCLVPLAAGFTAEAVPSKVYRIMGAERRILAIAEPGSDLERVVAEADAGIVVPPLRAEMLAQAVLAALKNDGGVTTGKARKYVLDNVDRETITSAYSALLTEAAAAGI
ncbi:MAG: glycosyltransferase family 4 protein [Gemmatimonadaceae bacterium]